MNERYAGFWIRFVASFIDAFFHMTAVFMVDFILFSIIKPDMEYIDYIFHGGLVSGVTNILIAVLYFGVLTSKYGGTPGKWLMGLRVVGENGQSISLGRAIGRYFAYALSNILYVGYIMVGLTEKKQGLHDKICNTYVIYKNR